MFENIPAVSYEEFDTILKQSGAKRTLTALGEAYCNLNLDAQMVFAEFHMALIKLVNIGIYGCKTSNEVNRVFQLVEYDAFTCPKPEQLSDEMWDIISTLIIAQRTVIKSVGQTIALMKPQINYVVNNKLKDFKSTPSKGMLTVVK